MQQIIIILIFVFVLIILGILVFKYLSGEFSIKSRELIKSNTYNVFVFDICKGRETHEVYKITYMDGSIKFKTYTYQH